MEEDDDDSFDCSCCADEDADADEDEDYDDNDDERNYDLDAYYEWVKEHDHWFIAERVGLDLDACYDDEVTYTIRIKK